jgi:hypothetical protein
MHSDNPKTPESIVINSVKRYGKTKRVEGYLAGLELAMTLFNYLTAPSSAQPQDQQNWAAHAIAAYCIRHRLPFPEAIEPIVAAAINNKDEPKNE